MVAVVAIQIMKIPQVIYLGALSHLIATLIPRLSAHPPVQAQCKVHRPWALFHEGTVIINLLIYAYIQEHYSTRKADSLRCQRTEVTQYVSCGTVWSLREQYLPWYKASRKECNIIYPDRSRQCIWMLEHHTLILLQECTNQCQCGSMYVETLCA